MAGIAGYFGQARAPEVLQGMVRKLAHRGRDGEALYNANPVFMGVRDKAGRASVQPSYSHDDSIVVLFAGDISNYAALRDDLARKGMQFRTESVPELILHLYEAYGLNLATHLRGRFVFAVHDTLKDFVFIARDRLGQEPLYYTTTQSGDFVFGSEVKAILEHPSVQVIPDMRSVDAYLTMGYSPTPGSLFKSIHKLPAGHRIIWNPGLHVMVEPYWKWESYTEPDASLKTDADYMARFETLVQDATTHAVHGLRQPGVRLNGTAEDTLVAAEMKRQSVPLTEAFTVGFDDGDAALAPGREIAQRLGLRHHEIICAPPDMEKLPEIIWANDEPVAHSSALTTYLLAQHAAVHVDGVVTGAAAENFMAGNIQQEIFLNMMRGTGLSAWFFKTMLGVMPQSWMQKQFDNGGKIGEQCRSRLMGFLGEINRRAPLMHKYSFLMPGFTAREKNGFYGDAISPFMETFIDAQKDPEGWKTLISRTVALQKDHGLQDNVLMPYDKASAMSGLPLRTPFADHSMAEFMMGLPDHLRFSHRHGRVILRRQLQKMMPDMPEITHKSASLPMFKFMSTRLMREMIETCLSENSMKKRGLFKPEGVRALVQQSREGDVLCLHQVFTLMMLEMWFRIYVDREKGWISR